MLNARDGKPSYPRYVAVVWPLWILLWTVTGYGIARAVGAVSFATFATLLGWVPGLLLCALVRLFTRNKFVYGAPPEPLRPSDPYVGPLNPDPATVTLIPGTGGVAIVAPALSVDSVEDDDAVRARLLATGEESPVVE